MSELKHTPEPWQRDGTAIFDCQHFPEMVATTSPAMCGPGMTNATFNAQRIVDCVNALAGIPNPAEFVRAAEANADLMKKAVALLDPCMSESDIRKLRGHFLEALSVFRAAGGAK
jgi:hypothetical protein